MFVQVEQEIGTYAVALNPKSNLAHGDSLHHSNNPNGQGGLDANKAEAPVNICRGFLSHISHAPQLVQTCLTKGLRRGKVKKQI